MRKQSLFRFGFIIFLTMCGMTVSGCALFLLGSGAVGGYAISSDESISFSDASYNEVWKAVKDAVIDKGTVTFEDKSGGQLEAVVEKSAVQVDLEQITQESVRLSIRARKLKGLLPDLELAQKLHGQAIRNIP